MTTTALLARHRETFRAVGEVVVPELAQADETSWREIEATVARALAQRPPRLVRQFKLLLRTLAIISRLRFRRSLRDVDVMRRERLLIGFQRSSLRQLRRGIWGLRSLVLMAHYTQPRVMEALGYRADARGWNARSAR